MKNQALPPSLLGRIAIGVALLGAVVTLACSTSVPTSVPPVLTPSATPARTTETTAEKDEPKVGYRVGNLAPDFTITTTDGRAVNRDDILAEDKPFILYFFATW